ncbi:MAG: SpoIIE family protein phosphatase [Saprospiraceae bacterium]|nr:SpoIIE family protein phosphatase [Saprospiraceae bacterium]
MSRELAILEKLEKELNLKQLQIKSLLTITQAINDNISAEGLYNMYKSFLSWEMEIDKMVLFIKVDEKWKCAATINASKENSGVLVPKIIKYKRLHTIKDEDEEILTDFDIIIPVFHKEQPLAYAIIGGIREKSDLYNRIQFITTITNIIAVAIENKRLFKQQIEQERLKREIQLASEVQQMLIPESFPCCEEYALSKIYKPHFNIGGDYIDFISFDKNRFAFCIADISGKGVAAALLMANFQAIIQTFIYQYRDLETFIFALNQAVYRITKADKYITFFIAEIDTRKMELKYINAGHYPPVLINGGKLRRLEEGTTVIGAFEKLPVIKEEIVPIKKDALILSFTDGLADLRNEEGDFFEDKKIENFVLNNSNKTPVEFNEELMSEINIFKGDQEYSDDIAVLTCKVF